jgi:methylase of polypeptide subunit release factors
VSQSDDALTALLRWLEAADYDFVAVTPATHTRVLARDASPSADPRDIFGWSRPIDRRSVDSKVADLLAIADATIEQRDELRSAVRVAQVGGRLFLHSSFPTEDPDAVFLGPDTYRFARFVAEKMHGRACPATIVDMGAGSGAGGILAGLAAPGSRLTLVDRNPLALRLAAINAEAAALKPQLLEADTLDELAEPADLIIANPPYMIDGARRAYRDGGGLLGMGLALDWAVAGASKLTAGAVMLLYSGSPVVEGTLVLAESLTERMGGSGCTITIEELDPDVFGEELDSPAYSEVERIAALGIVIEAAD